MKDEVANLSFIQSERIQSLLFAVLVAKRFHLQYRIGYRYWQISVCSISDYQAISEGPYRCITNYM